LTLGFHLPSLRVIISGGLANNNVKCLVLGRSQIKSAKNLQNFVKISKIGKKKGVKTANAGRRSSHSNPNHTPILPRLLLIYASFPRLLQIGLLLSQRRLLTGVLCYIISRQYHLTKSDHPRQLKNPQILGFSHKLLRIKSLQSQKQTFIRQTSGGFIISASSFPTTLPRASLIFSSEWFML
jgi:hypothetical protein